MLKRLLNIRLSYIYPTLFVIFFIALTYVSPAKLTPGQLALYSVNTFLFGFYFSPLLNAQKARVDSLGKTVRADVMAALDILAQSHLLSEEVRHQLKVRLKLYIQSVNHNPKVTADNVYYDELLRFTKQPKFKDDSVMDAVYKQVSGTQDNRDQLQNLFESNVFSHEWLVVLVLFSVTLYFVMQTDYNHVLWFRALLAILCTGISLMLVILVKYATLTHKQAKRIWTPVDELLKDHFEDVDPDEVLALKHRIQHQQ